MNKFKNDLVKGKVGEKMVADYFRSVGRDVVEIEGYCKEYDMIVNGFYVEVKNDGDPKQMRENPNIVLEMYCNNKESGVLTTKSKYYVYLYNILEECYVIIVDDLKRYLLDRREKEMRWQKYIAENNDIDFDLEFDMPGLFMVYDNSDGKDSKHKAKGYIIPIQHLVELGIASKSNNMKKYIWGL
jgi:hypothetical protein